MKPLLRRFLFILLSTTVISAVASGGLAVVKAQSEYYGVCSQLNGFPGFLQDAGLLQTGTCRSHRGDDDLAFDDHRDGRGDHDDHGEQCNVGSECRVGGKRGSCRSENLPGRRNICVCVTNVSK